MQGRWRVDATGCSQLVFENGCPPCVRMGELVLGLAMAQETWQRVACTGVRCRVVGRRAVPERRKVADTSARGVVGAMHSACVVSMHRTLF